MKVFQGKKVDKVAAAKPAKAKEAMDSESGTASETQGASHQAEKDKLDERKVKPFKPISEEEAESEDKEVSWIEFEMVDEADQPMAGVQYEVEMPDGSIAAGVLDNKGFARIDGCEPGTCKISFPELDKDAWEPI